MNVAEDFSNADDFLLLAKAFVQAKFESVNKQLPFFAPYTKPGSMLGLNFIHSDQP